MEKNKLSRLFNPGDVVSVNGHMDSITFHGERGVIAFEHPLGHYYPDSNEKGCIEKLWAVDFESNFEEVQKTLKDRVRSFHNCYRVGLPYLPRSTGYYLREKFLKKIVKDTFEEDGQE